MKHRDPYVSPLHPSRDDGYFYDRYGAHPWPEVRAAAIIQMRDFDWKPRRWKEAEWGSDYFDAEKRK